MMMMMTPVVISHTFIIKTVVQVADLSQWKHLIDIWTFDSNNCRRQQDIWAFDSLYTGVCNVRRVTCSRNAIKQSITSYECNYYFINYKLTFHYKTKAAHAQRGVCVLGQPGRAAAAQSVMGRQRAAAKTTGNVWWRGWSPRHIPLFVDECPVTQV